MAADRSSLMRALAAEPGRIEPGLQVFLDDAVGLEGPIDLVARDARGGAVVIGVADGDDLLALAHTLAQRAWLTPRIRDWARLAPHLKLVPALGVRAILCSPQFDARSEALARTLGEPAVRLHRIDGFAGLSPSPARVPDAGPTAPSRPAAAKAAEHHAAPEAGAPVSARKAPSAAVPEPARGVAPGATDRSLPAPSQERAEPPADADTPGGSIRSRFRTGLVDPARRTSARPRSAPRGGSGAT